MEKNQPANKNSRPDAKTEEPNKPSLEAEEEEAAARQEPMGSIAAAVPGSDELAQDAMESAELPGAESPEIRDRPETTAGTEAKAEGEEIAGKGQSHDHRD